ncbi:hypothetical protein HDU98_010836 [Podochytrium sp. JEL0797]|nr:hypothetical protein HDU98_010836 [Podochytrium sp. JEL0797]
MLSNLDTLADSAVVDKQESESEPRIALIVSAVGSGTDRVSIPPVSVLRSRLIQVPYFAALERFEGFKDEVVDLRRFTPLTTEFETTSLETETWAVVAELIRLSIEGMTGKVAAEMLVRGRVWVKKVSVPVKRKVTGIAVSARLSPPSSVGGASRKGVDSGRRKPVVAAKRDSALAGTPSKPRELDSHEDPDFLVLWQLLFSIGDYLALDSLKEVLVATLRDLAHGVKCGCVQQCVGGPGVVLRFAILTGGVLGVEEFVGECVGVMAKSWDKVYSHSLFPKLPIVVHVQIAQRVVDSVQIDSILATLWGLLHLQSRVAMRPNANLAALLDQVEARVDRVLCIGRGVSPVAKRGGTGKSNEGGKASEMLMAVWDSDGVLKEWVRREIRASVSVGVLVDGVAGLSVSPSRLPEKRRVQVVETLTPAVEELVRRFLGTLEGGNVVAFLRVFERILGDIGEGDKVAGEGVVVWRGGGSSVGYRVFKSGYRACAAFAGKRWMNVGITRGSVSTATAQLLCEAAGVSMKELFSQKRAPHTLAALRVEASLVGESEAIAVREDSALRLMLLNRPSALNAINTNMLNLMTPQLKVWDEADSTNVILLTAVEGCRSFCAGGDVKAMLRAKSQAPADLAHAMKFIESEYRLNHLVGTLKKPYISLMNGIAMGGGIGISVHAPFRIATENTLFSMPETSIGLFPDVGGSFFLPRLDGELGTYLGLTCHRLQGVEVFLSGIASHYMPAKRIPSLLQALAAIETDELVEINRLLEKYSEPLNQDVWRHWSLGGEVANAINRTFKFDTVEEIVEALHKENSDWAKKTLAELEAVSPMSLKATLRQLRNGRKMDFASCFRMEYRMVQGFLQTPDFFEGVTARLTEKRPPRFSPSFSALSSITPEEIESRFFTPFPTVQTTRAINSSLPKQNLEFLKDLTYFEYPHRTLSGLPTDWDVENVIAGRHRRGQQMMGLTKNQDVVNAFLAKWGAYDATVMGPDPQRLPRTATIDNGSGKGKKGLKEKITSILERRTPALT